MYRLISLAILLTAVNCHWCSGGPGSCHWRHPPHHFHHHHWHHMHGADSQFDRIAYHVIGSDESYQEYCKTNANTVQENYGSSGYILKYNLPGFDENSMTVQIKHRVIFVKATKATEVFQDIRVLSNIMKVEDAKWYHDGDSLVVLVPYKIEIDVEKTTSCSGNINRETLNVEHVPAPAPELDVRDLYRKSYHGIPASNFSPNNNLQKVKYY